MLTIASEDVGGDETYRHLADVIASWPVLSSEILNRPYARLIPGHTSEVQPPLWTITHKTWMALAVWFCSNPFPINLRFLADRSERIEGAVEPVGRGIRDCQHTALGDDYMARASLCRSGEAMGQGGGFRQRMQVDIAVNSADPYRRLVDGDWAGAERLGICAAPNRSLENQMMRENTFCGLEKRWTRPQESPCYR